MSTPSAHGTSVKGGGEEAVPLSLKDRILLGTIIFVFCLMPIASIAGGLGIPLLLAICGCAGILTAIPFRLQKIPLWILALFVFLLWALFSQFWSPYEANSSLTNAVKLTLGCVFYVMGLKAIVKTIDLRPILMAYVYVCMTVFLLIILIADLSTGFGLTFFFDPPNIGEDVLRKRGDAIMNTSNGIVILCLLSVPAATLMLTGSRIFKLCAGLIIGLTFWASFIGHLAIAEIAILVGFAFFALTFYFPRFGLKLVTGLSMALVLFAPIVGMMLSLVSEDQISKLPFSWEHRVEMWKYTSLKITQAPIFGHGFDSARTFSDTFETRGFTDLALISLHPHNAGLHIWLETGVVGAIFAVIFLWLLGRRAIFMSNTSRYMAAACASLIAMASLISAVSYGVWQDWWWAGLFYVAGCLHLIKIHSPMSAKG